MTRGGRLYREGVGTRSGIVAAISVVLLLLALPPGTRAPRRLAWAAPFPGGATVAGDAAACPPDTLPDGPPGATPICVHITYNDGEGAPLSATPNQHHDRSGRLVRYEQIARLPERPADYDSYRYPVSPGMEGGHHVVSGYDLDRPDALQRRGRKLSHVGHGGLDLPQTRGASVAVVALEHQEGEADVLFAGPLFGNTVVTRHQLREGGQIREYVVLHGHLEAIAPGARAGARLADGDAIGTVGDSGSPGFTHLHLEVRRVRDGVDLRRVPAGALLVAEWNTVACDPRNVLPLARP